MEISAALLALWLRRTFSSSISQFNHSNKTRYWHYLTEQIMLARAEKLIILLTDRVK